jgi:hypothetical protein
MFSLAMTSLAMVNLICLAMVNLAS